MEEELVALLPRLRRFARALCRDSTEADDLVQAACERALTRRDRFLPGTRLDSWLHRMMQNLWLDRGRTAQARREHLDIDTVGDLAGVDGRDETEARILLAQGREGVGPLPEGRRGWPPCGRGSVGASPGCRARDCRSARPRRGSPCRSGP